MTSSRTIAEVFVKER